MHLPCRSLLPTRWLVGVGVWGLVTASAAGQTDPSLAPAYRDSARRLCNDAADEFRARLSGPDGREARFGLAASLLNAQPRTDAKVAEAATLLAEVAATNRDDELGINAAYLQARVWQFHRRPTDPAAARQLYEALYQKHPDHPLAQMATVKAWTLRLYDPAASAETRRAAFAQGETQAEKVTDADAQRDFHSLLAAACERFGYGEDVRLRHLLAQERATHTPLDQQRDLTITIAEVARRLGQTELAAEYYRRFLDASPRDYRHYTVEQRLAGLAAPVAP